jgi:hypothetical protein
MTIDMEELECVIEADLARISWLRESCLTERAYVLGLLKGLEFMKVDLKDISGFISQRFFETLYLRERDRLHDPLSSTEIGRLLETLRAELKTQGMLPERVHSICSEIKESTNAFRRRTDDLVKEMHDIINRTEHLATRSDREEFPNEREREELLGDMFEALKGAKCPARILAQLDPESGASPWNWKEGASRWD